MAEPVTFAFAAVSAAVSIGIKIGGFIAELQAAGDEFSDIVYQLQQTSNIITRLERIFRDTDSSFPVELSEEYRRDLLIRENELADLQFICKDVMRRLNQKGAWTRFKQKAELVHGDLNRITNRLMFFNQTIIAMITTHQSRVLALVHRDVGKVGKAGEQVRRAVVMDMSTRYGPQALRMMQDDGWGVESSSASGSGSSSTATTTAAMMSPASTSTATDSGGFLLAGAVPAPPYPGHEEGARATTPMPQRARTPMPPPQSVPPPPQSQPQQPTTAPSRPTSISISHSEASNLPIPVLTELTPDTPSHPLHPPPVLSAPKPEEEDYFDLPGMVPFMPPTPLQSPQSRPVSTQSWQEYYAPQKHQLQGQSQGTPSPLTTSTTISSSPNPLSPPQQPQPQHRATTPLPPQQFQPQYPLTPPANPPPQSTHPYYPPPPHPPPPQTQPHYSHTFTLTSHHPSVPPPPPPPAPPRQQQYQPYSPHNTYNPQSYGSGPPPPYASSGPGNTGDSRRFSSGSSVSNDRRLPVALTRGLRDAQDDGW